MDFANIDSNQGFTAGPTIDHLEELLSHPSFLSPGWLQVDPVWDPLRSHSRFRQLLASR